MSNILSSLSSLWARITRKVIDFFKWLFRVRTIPPGVDVPTKVLYVTAHGGDGEPWLPFERKTNYKSVIPADDNKILLGWRKHGFGKHRFNPFHVVPRKGQSLLRAARRDLKAAIGIQPTELVLAGNILIVIDRNLEARDEEMIRATAWTGTATETRQMIPAFFPTSAMTYTLDDSASVVSNYTSTESVVYDISAEFKLISEEMPEERVSKGSESTRTLASTPSIMPPQTIGQRWQRALSRALSPVQEGLVSKRANPLVINLPFRSSNGGTLLLPWQSMYPDDEFWYPLLTSGKKFVGRVDYDAAKDGEEIGKMRRWWFAVIDDQ